MTKVSIILKVLPVTQNSYMCLKMQKQIYHYMSFISQSNSQRLKANQDFQVYMYLNSTLFIEASECLNTHRLRKKNLRSTSLQRNPILTSLQRNLSKGPGILSLHFLSRRSKTFLHSFTPLLYTSVKQKQIVISSRNTKKKRE